MKGWKTKKIIANVEQICMFNILSRLKRTDFDQKYCAGKNRKLRNCSVFFLDS